MKAKTFMCVLICYKIFIDIILQVLLKVFKIIFVHNTFNVTKPLLLKYAFDCISSFM